MKRNKAFTLIELVSVLVILAILALIVTPLVLNIIKKARTSADKRSIDAYGRSIELAIADYLLDNGTFPASIDQLTIEYSGDRVVCSTTKLNSDSSVYLADCTVNERSVNYTYGKTSEDEYDYKVGTIITYNSINYYVLKNSKPSDSSIILLKSEPLTVEEVNTYLNDLYDIQVYDSNGYGGMQYSSSDISDYNASYVKSVIDNWGNDKLNMADIINLRLITKDEYLMNCNEETKMGISDSYKLIVPQYEWLYNDDYWYWTMSIIEEDHSTSCGVVYSIEQNAQLSKDSICAHSGGFSGVVRPVIEIKKSALN